MSHAGHKIVKCRDCEVVLYQCRCIGPDKRVEYSDTPCTACLKKAAQEADEAVGLTD